MRQQQINYMLDAILAETNKYIRTQVATARDDEARKNYTGAIVDNILGSISIKNPVYSWSIISMVS